MESKGARRNERHGDLLRRESVTGGLISPIRRPLTIQWVTRPFFYSQKKVRSGPMSTGHLEPEWRLSQVVEHALVG